MLILTTTTMFGVGNAHLIEDPNYPPFNINSIPKLTSLCNDALSSTYICQSGSIDDFRKDLKNASTHHTFLSSSIKTWGVGEDVLRYALSVSSAFCEAQYLTGRGGALRLVAPSSMLTG